MNKYITVKEFAARADITRSTVYGLIKRSSINLKVSERYKGAMVIKVIAESELKRLGYE